MSEIEIKTIERLRTEYAQRSCRNPNYSLRAFARSLNKSHSLISLVMSGKRRPSRKLIEMLSKELGSAQISPNPSIEKSFPEISEERFSQVSDWVHYAILSLLDIPGFRLDDQNVSKRLAVPVKKASIAIEELKNAGYVGWVKGRFRQTVPPIRVASSVASDIRTRHARDLLKKAEEAMDQVPFEERDLTSITFAMSKKNVPYASEKIAKFRRELCRELEDQSPADSVYTLMVQLVPLTRFSDNQKRSKKENNRETQ